jgi:hypothetical protein
MTTDITPENVARMLDGVTPVPWFMQDFTAPEVNEAPGAWDVHVSCTWPDHIPVASMGGGFEGHKALWQARNDARFIAWAREAVPALAADRDGWLSNAMAARKKCAEQETLREAAEAENEKLQAKLAERDAENARLQAALTACAGVNHDCVAKMRIARAALQEMKP